MWDREERGCRIGRRQGLGKGGGRDWDIEVAGTGIWKWPSVG